MLVAAAAAATEDAARARCRVPRRGARRARALARAWRAGTHLQAAMRGGRARAVRGVRPDAPRARGRGAAVHRARGRSRFAWDLDATDGVAAPVLSPADGIPPRSAVAVETEPGRARLGTGARERVGPYVPKQTLGPGGDASLGFWGNERETFYAARQLAEDRILRRYASGLLAHFLRRRTWHTLRVALRINAPRVRHPPQCVGRVRPPQPLRKPQMSLCAASSCVAPAAKSPVLARRPGVPVPVTPRAAPRRRFAHPRV